MTLLVAFAAYPMAAAVRRIRRRPRRQAPRSARWLAVLGPASVAGTLLYLLVLLATAAKVSGPVVLGRPVVWLALQLLACATVTATLAVAYGLLRHRPADRIRLSLLTAGGLLFTAWAIHWGLLLP